MPDWTRSMQQTFEFYKVDPSTWEDKEAVSTVTNCTITRDEEDETLGSASITCDEDLSDEYVRAYLVTVQDGERDKTPLGTHLYESPSRQYDGKRSYADQDGYSPLIELKEKNPPIGFSLARGNDILQQAGLIAAEKMRAPVVASSASRTLSGSFVSELSDNYLYFLQDLLALANYSFGIDALGNILFKPKQAIYNMKPVWEFNDDNSSILYPDVEMEKDLFDIPNVVEVIYSTPSGSYMYAKATNNSPKSIISTRNRGREVVYRETSPSLSGIVTQDTLKSYAVDLLRQMSSCEYKVRYTHGYCPVRLGDCVLLNYEAAGLIDIRAKVTRQIIRCESGCSVDETAIYTEQLWEGND